MKQARSKRPEEGRAAAEVMRWRFEKLVEAGYDGPTASTLARSLEIDLDLAVRLVRDGCPPETAVRILV
jgi:hypothetical protein